MIVVTADQKRSTRHGDRVPEALGALATDPPAGIRLPFERTVGDEIQGLLDSPAAVVWAVTRLVRIGGWRIGIGLGDVARPLPDTTRAATGSAFVAAREAVNASHSVPTDLRVLRAAVGADGYGQDEPTRQAESALWLLTAVLRRRTAEGWEIAEMAESGLSGREMAARLRISPSAVSQRLARACTQEAQRGAELAEALLAVAIQTAKASTGDQPTRDGATGGQPSRRHTGAGA
jgi:hypothetical protein